MKILKIRFENIHSLKGRHDIDFENGWLADAGLFAITGPTGSGKSTLLDVITLALFNRIARVDKAVSNSMLEDDGGVMTRNMKHCFAEVEYRANGKEYRSHWSIERNRNNNLNPRKQELVDMATNEIIETGTKTPEKNQQIIGLSYEQFVKAMVLSQGEFSRLLQAPRNERNKLLEDITGARSYRNIGKAVYQQYKELENTIKLKEAGLETIELLSAEMIAEKNAKLKTLIQVKPKIEKDYKAANEKIRIREELQKKQSEWKDLDVEKQKYSDDFKVFEPFITVLATHERLSKYADILRDFDTTTLEISKLNDHLEQIKKSKSDIEIQQKSYLDTVSKLVKEKTEITSANLKLEVFRNNINELQSDEKKKLDEAKLHQNQLNNYLRSLNTLGYRIEHADKINEFQPQFEALQNAVQELIKASGQDSLNALETRLADLRVLNDSSGKLLLKKELDLKYKTTLKNLHESLKKEENNLQEDIKKIAVLETEIFNLKSELTTLETQLEAQRKHQNLNVYRQQLIPEQPCPLCGSLDHPYALHEPVFDVKEALLKEKKRLLETQSELAISLSQKNNFQKEKIMNFTSEIQKNSVEKSENQKLLLALAQQLKWNPEDSLEQLQNQSIALHKNIQNAENSKKAFQAQAILQDASISLQQWQSALTIYIEKKKARVSLYDQDDINQKTSVLSSQITRSIADLTSSEKQLQDAILKLKTLTNDYVKKQNTLDSIILNEQLKSTEALRNAILPEEKAIRIRNQQSKLKETQTRISEREKALQKTIKELKEKDDANLSIDALNTLFRTLKKELDELLINSGKIAQHLEEDSKARIRQQNVLEELKLLKKDFALWKTMTDLIGDANGNKFSNFVQDLTLEQLIGFANKRLAEFSDRYLLDIPTAEEAEKSDTLKVFDSYIGNSRRSVKTLSGGETFLVSLAMAFALSDIASRNVKIESLFIDEGFGTLDPETLDQAITILEKMQNEGDKSVGVISHVSALKERITTQIKLEKGSLGYSTLSIVQ